MILQKTPSGPLVGRVVVRRTIQTLCSGDQRLRNLLITIFNNGSLGAREAREEVTEQGGGGAGPQRSTNVAGRRVAGKSNRSMRVTYRYQRDSCISDQSQTLL